VEHPKQHRLQLAANNESKQRTDLAVATQDPAGWTIGDMLQYALEQQKTKKKPSHTSLISVFRLRNNYSSKNAFFRRCFLIC
jgi:hypothetical protein